MLQLCFKTPSVKTSDPNHVFNFAPMNKLTRLYSCAPFCLFRLRIKLKQNEHMVASVLWYSSKNLCFLEEKKEKINFFSEVLGNMN